MIVCSCNVLSDQDVRLAMAHPQSPRSAGKVYGCLGCSPQCGRCARTIRAILDEARAACGAGPSCDDDIAVGGMAVVDVIDADA